MKRLLIFIVLLLSGVSFGQSICARNSNCAYTGNNTHAGKEFFGGLHLIDSTKHNLLTEIAACPTTGCHIVDVATPGSVVTVSAQLAMQDGLTLELACGVEYQFTYQLGAGIVPHSNSRLILPCGNQPATQGGTQLTWKGAGDKNFIEYNNSADLSNFHLINPRLRDGRTSPTAGWAVYLTSATNQTEVIDANINGFPSGMAWTRSDPSHPGPNYAFIKHPFFGSIKGDCLLIEYAVATVDVEGMDADNCGSSDPTQYGGLKIRNLDGLRAAINVHGTYRFENSTNAATYSDNAVILDTTNNVPVVIDDLQVFKTTSAPSQVGAIIKNTGSNARLLVHAATTTNGAPYGTWTNWIDDQFVSKQVAISDWGSKVDGLEYRPFDYIKANGTFWHFGSGGDIASLRVRRFGESADRIRVGSSVQFGDGTNASTLDVAISRKQANVLQVTPNGAGYAGLAAQYFSSGDFTLAARTGVHRMAANEAACWRNNANNADKCLAESANDELTWNGSPVGGKLNWQKGAGGITGTGAAATVYTYTIPAGSLAAGQCVRATAWFAKTGSTSTAYQWNFGATALSAQSSTNSTSTAAKAVLNVCADSGSTTAQTAIADPMFIGTGGVSGSVATAAENFANNITISFTFNVAATDSVTPKGFLVERIGQ